MAERLAVVSGGTRGLGRAVTLELAGAGYDVVAVYHADDRAAEELRLAAAARPGGVRVECLRCDLAREPLALPARGPFEGFVLVHAAAASFDVKPLHLVTADELAEQWAVAVRGLHACALPLLRLLPRTRRGTIVAISSTAAVEPGGPPRGFGAYASAKAAMQALVKSLAREYGDRGLRTLSVAPGFMATSLTDRWPAALREAVAARGSCTPLEAARFVRALIEDETLPAAGEEYLVRSPAVDPTP
jgi:3-oxoacyl-[acyl-carrier protein] reductase